MEPSINHPSVLTTENFNALLSWLDNPATEKPAVADEFLSSLGYACRKRQGRERLAPMSLSHIVAEVEREERERRLAATAKPSAPPPPSPPELPELPEKHGEEPAEAQETPTAGLLPLPDENGYLRADIDSITVAGSIVWHYDNLEGNITRGKPISMAFLQTVLFEVYGIYLAERDTRITKEHPQMWRFGPVFPRVFNKANKPGGLGDVRQTMNELRSVIPVVDRLVERTVRRAALDGISAVTRQQTAKQSPWGRCKEANPEKWGTPLNDRQIADHYKKLILDRKNKIEHPTKGVKRKK